MSEAVLDAGPLIHLLELDALDALGGFAVLRVPDAIWDEVNRHQPVALRNPDLSLLRVSAPPASQDLQILARAFSLDRGEIEALALLNTLPQALFLTDDAAARLAAEQLGFRAHGTIGLLVRSARRGFRSQENILSLLRDLPQRSSLYVRPALLESIVQRLEQEWRA